VGDTGRPQFRAGALKAGLPSDLDPSLAGRKAVLGVRAEHVHAMTSDTVDATAGRVNLIEPLGDATLIFFDYGGPARLVAKVDPDLPLAPNDPIGFTFQAPACRLFDPETGVRLN
jgi:ABC-type sugar transport system ATPase subunit